MYFKRLEMQGFKSFADPVTIDFHEGITCIVGPNGSGKSNISDAVRWVLGEQSPKALRGGKMEEVIFAGTASRKSRGMAEVTIVLDNAAGILDIDYSEVAITRRMYRSGESEYLINNNPCRLRDIRELIMDTGIGVDGYSIIGQGKIADIVSTKPEARREIFEEAAGIVMYKTKRAETERKLDATNIRLDRVKDILNEIEGRIDGLREESEKAKEYLELKDRYVGLEVNVILHNIDTINENSKVYKDDIARIEREIQEATGDETGISAKYAELNAKREILEKHELTARDNILKLVQEINEITSRDELSKERLSGIENETGILSADIEMLETRLKEEQESFVKLKEERDSFDREIAAAKKVLDDKVVAYNQAAAEQTEATTKTEEARAKLFQLNSEMAGCDSEIKGMENIVENLISRRTSLQSLSSETGQVREELERTVKEKEEERTAKEKEYAQLEETLKELSAKRESLMEEIKTLAENLEKYRIDLSTSISRKRTMEEMESNYDGYTAGVKAIMRNPHQGVRGVVAELMTVPQGYETAIETALGGKLQNIICEKDDDAKRSVNYLKEHKAGRATFLPIETIRGRRTPDLDAIKSDSGYIDLANNIIEYNDEYKDIYSYLLGATCVTKDMDSAIRLAKKDTGLKFVTLDGEIVNARGAITGGIINKQSANILERRAEINSLSEQIESLEKNSKETDEALQAKRQILSSDSEKEQQVGAEKHRLDVEMSALERDIQAINDSLAKEELNFNRYDDEMNRIFQQLQDAEEMTSKQKARIAEINEEIEVLSKDITCGQEEIGKKREISEAASEEVTAARIKLNAIENRGESQRLLADRVENQIAEYTGQIEEKQQALSQLAEEKQQLIKAVEESTGSEAKIVEKQAIEESLANLQKDRSILAEELAQVEKDRNEFALKLNDLRDSKFQIEVKATRGETQLENLKEKLWDEFELSLAQAQDLRNEEFVFSRAVRETREIRSRMRELGDVNVGAISEYELVSQRYEEMTTQRDDINEAKEGLENIINELEKTIKLRFKENFDKVVDNFQVIFTELFGGGQAELRLENEEDPLNSGIDIIAQPPGKKLQNINLMSGGEKTMTAIALMFAVLKTKPTPFCILDEVEAALDDSNIDRFANYLKNFREIQFALVTHQKATMEHADVLYGVTMPEQGISKMLSLRLGDDFEL